MSIYNNPKSFVDGVANYYGIEASNSPVQVSHEKTSSSFWSHSPFWYGWGGGGNHQHVTVVNSSPTIPTIPTNLEEWKNALDKERKESFSWTAVKVGAAGTIGLMGAAGYYAKRYKTDGKELRATRDFQTKVLPTLSKPQQTELTPIVEKHIEILETKQSKSIKYSVINAGLLSAAIASFIGGMREMVWLFKGAFMSMVPTAALGSFTCAWHWSDEDSLPKTMQATVLKLQQKLEGSSS